MCRLLAGVRAFAVSAPGDVASCTVPHTLHALLPCLGILTNIFLIASLGATAYIRFGVWLLISVAFYMFYSVHNSPATPGQYSGVYDVELIENRGGVDEEPLPKSFGNQFEATMHGKAGAGTHSRSPQSSNPSSLGVDIR